MPAQREVRDKKVFGCCFIRHLGDNHVLDGWMFAEDTFNFCYLNPLPSNLHLSKINTANKEEVALDWQTMYLIIRRKVLKSGQISSAVQTMLPRFVTVQTKNGRVGQIRFVQIAHKNGRAAQIEHAGFSWPPHSLLALAVSSFFLNQDIRSVIR